MYCVAECSCEVQKLANSCWSMGLRENNDIRNYSAVEDELASIWELIGEGLGNYWSQIWKLFCKGPPEVEMRASDVGIKRAEQQDVFNCFWL